MDHSENLWFYKSQILNFITLSPLMRINEEKEYGKSKRYTKWEHLIALVISPSRPYFEEELLQHLTDHPVIMST